VWDDRQGSDGSCFLEPNATQIGASKIGIPKIDTVEPRVPERGFGETFSAQIRFGKIDCVYQEANLTVLTAGAAYGKPRVDRVLTIPF
jgi:hypothetical protein